ncbi:MAG: hypothetical protein IKK75_13695 [Clostridia bacterium]|nr:hypothetical protein [Clostridia bacterium]
MSLDTKLKKIETAMAGGGRDCTVQYKWGKGPLGSVRIPVADALTDGRAGKLKSIFFPLTFNEEQTERYHHNDILHEIDDFIDGIRRDTNEPTCSNLIICSRPIVYARQHPTKRGGYYITEDGHVFFQTEWREVLEKYGAGFIIVKDYDESKEPWAK